MPQQRRLNMVQLGLVKDADQVPEGFTRVFVRAGSSTTLEPTVYSRPDRQGVQQFELALDVIPGVDNIPTWAPFLASVIENMGWERWWIDSFSLSEVLDRYITEALRLWGLEFWKYYSSDGVVLVQTGLQREAVSLSINAWEDRFSHVRLSKLYDYDAMEREQQAQVQQRKNKFKQLLTPKFLAPKKGA